MADVEVARRPVGRRREDFTDLHAWTEVYSAGRGLDRPRPDQRACWPARGTSRSPARADPVDAPRRSPARTPGRARRTTTRSAEEFTFEMRVTRIDEHAARDEALQRGAVGGDRRARAGRSIAISSALRRAADDGRRADVRRRSTTATRAEWNTAALGPTKRALADVCCARLRDALRAGRPAAPRAGQVVPGRAAAALGVLLLLPRATASRSGTSPACSPRTIPTRAADARSRPRGSSRALARAAGRRRRSSRSRPTRTSTTTCGASAGCRPTSTCSTASSTIPIERARLARVFGAGPRARWPATCCRCAPAAPARPSRGRAATGWCAASACILMPATRRWGSGCRSTASPGRRRRRVRGSTSAIR